LCTKTVRSSSVPLRTLVRAVRALGRPCAISARPCAPSAPDRILTATRPTVKKNLRG